ncbi:sensor histidine kinase [Lachnospiraceae bacterium KM106-2]|nr:sensor histidine kinase [Lachnospiraceae bacterium KM106-2]
MRLKAKLIIAFMVIIIFPVLLISCTTGFIIQKQVDSVQQSYDVTSDTLQVIKNPIHILNRVTRGIYNDIKLLALKNPKKLEDSNYIKSVNGELKEKYSFLIVRVNDKVTYMGNQKKGEQVVNSLPKFGEYSTDVDGGMYLGGDCSLLVKQQDFFNTRGQECSIFVVTDVNTLVPQIRTSMIQIVIAAVIIIWLTGSFLSFWLYRTMIRPINSLRTATNRMKEGDLDFSIHSNNKDEIGLLCEDFEEMRERLKELIETKISYEEKSRELVSNISHDLKTPLTAIKGYAEGIIDGVADTEEKQDKYVKTIYAKACDMTALVEELGLYSQYDCDNIPYHFVKVDVEQYFSDCIGELALDLEVKNIDIGYFNYTDQNLTIFVDPEQLKRVINNIIGNSAKYMDKKKGIINIRIQDQDSYVRVEIEDNGKGIAAKDIPYIFDRFYRADTSRNSAKGGSGLGLAIVKKIIEDHKGTIWVSSKEGMGTKICFTLLKEEVPNE